jgi:hypothetical protein
LRLLAEPFQFRLQRHDLARDDRVVRLRADGVDFAVHFLREKIQRAPDRLLRFPAILKLLKWLCSRVNSSEMSERSANKTISFNSRSSSGAMFSMPAL